MAFYGLSFILPLHSRTKVEPGLELEIQRIFCITENGYLIDSYIYIDSCCLCIDFALFMLIFRYLSGLFSLGTVTLESNLSLSLGVFGL